MVMVQVEPEQMPTALVVVMALVEPGRMPTALVVVMVLVEPGRMPTVLVVEVEQAGWVQVEGLVRVVIRLVLTDQVVLAQVEPFPVVEMGLALTGLAGKVQGLGLADLRGADLVVAEQAGMEVQAALVQVALGSLVEMELGPTDLVVTDLGATDLMVAPTGLEATVLAELDSVAMAQVSQAVA
jgi:hypothetical protein